VGTENSLVAINSSGSSASPGAVAAGASAGRKPMERFFFARQAEPVEASRESSPGRLWPRSKSLDLPLRQLPGQVNMHAQ
jgi:hypothetical protein